LIKVLIEIGRRVGLFLRVADVLIPRIYFSGEFSIDVKTGLISLTLVDVGVDWLKILTCVVF
jgi:hypothetical protein